MSTVVIHPAFRPSAAMASASVALASSLGNARSAKVAWDAMRPVWPRTPAPAAPTIAGAAKSGSASTATPVRRGASATFTRSRLQAT